MNKLSAFLIGVAMIMAMPLISSAQNAYEVKGLVLDEAGPMVGVTVLEKGTQNGTSTGTEGDFLLKVSSPAALVEISSIGYETIVFAANQLPAKVILKPGFRNVGGDGRRGIRLAQQEGNFIFRGFCKRG